MADRGYIGGDDDMFQRYERRDYTPRLFCSWSKHLAEVGGYWNHFKFGAKITLMLIPILISSVVHILVPSLLPFYADTWIIKIGEQCMVARGYKIDKSQER